MHYCRLSPLGLVSVSCYLAQEETMVVLPSIRPGEDMVESPVAD